MTTAYQLTAGTNIIRTSDGATIPPDPGNADYQMYLAWVAAGNTATPYAAPTPTAAQQASAALAAGIAITSTGTPTLNGVYALDQASQSNVNATVTYILLNGTFPGGGSTMSWIDQAGNAHTWPSVTEFKAFATAYANYVAAIALYAASNGAAGSLPSNAVTIT